MSCFVIFMAFKHFQVFNHESTSTYINHCGNLWQETVDSTIHGDDCYYCYCYVLITIILMLHIWNHAFNPSLSFFRPRFNPVIFRLLGFLEAHSPILNPTNATVEHVLPQLAHVVRHAIPKLAHSIGHRSVGAMPAETPVKEVSLYQNHLSSYPNINLKRNILVWFADLPWFALIWKHVSNKFPWSKSWRLSPGECQAKCSVPTVWSKKTLKKLRVWYNP